MHSTIYFLFSSNLLIWNHNTRIVFRCYQVRAADYSRSRQLPPKILFKRNPLLTQTPHFPHSRRQPSSQGCPDPHPIAPLNDSIEVLFAQVGPANYLPDFRAFNCTN